MSCLGIIFSYSDRENLRELTKIRAMASLPIAGKYRIIDLVLSNYVNSGVYDVSVITKMNYHSLVDHLGSGAEWDLSRKIGGLRVLTPFANPDATISEGIYRGTLDALANHMHSIRRSMADYVIISGSRILYTMDFQKVLEQHIAKGSDITVVCADNFNGEHRVPQGVPTFDMDEDGRIKNVNISTDEILNHEGFFSLGVFVLRKTLLESLVADTVSHDRYDFNRDVLERLSPVLKIHGYRYEKQLLEISTVGGYMKANLDLLDESFADKVFSNTVYTKVKDSVPVYYGPNCYVENAMISDGCQIDGTVVNCVLSRNVKIEKGAVVKDSIIMQNTEVMENSNVEHCILDKDVIVREGREIFGHETYPIVVPKLSII